MMSDNKILTVSYGTFSCTLEGFDDPFSTMRGIAEYFRDLAADDRYFGAEPPTPDANMLHSIAEKEIQRRVEAQVQDNGVVLRQVETQVAQNDDTSAPAAAHPVAAPVASAAPVATELKDTDSKAPAAVAQPAQLKQSDQPSSDPQDVSPAHNADAVNAAAQEAVQAPAQEAVEAPRSDVSSAPAQPAAQSIASALTGSTPSIADKLERIRAAVSQRTASEYSEDQHAAESFGTAAPLLSEDESNAPDMEAAAPLASPQASVEARDHNTAEADDSAEASSDEPVRAQPVAAAQQDNTAQQNEDLEQAEKQKRRKARRLRREAEQQKKAEAEAALKAAQVKQEDTPVEETVSQDVSPQVIEDAAVDQSTETDAAQSAAAQNGKSISDADIAVSDETPENGSAPKPLRRARARVVKMRRADLEAKTATAAAAVLHNEENTSNLEEAAIEDVASVSTQNEIAQTDELSEALNTSLDVNTLDDVSLSPETSEDLAGTADDELQDALRRELGENILDDLPKAERPEPVAQDEDEAELLRQLAEVTGESMDTAEVVQDEPQTAIIEDAEFTDVNDAIGALILDTDTPKAQEDEISLAEAKTTLLGDDDLAADDVSNGETDLADAETRNVFEESDEDVTRLLDTTEREMKDGENTRRRNAIQHLKAAVAATRADRKHVDAEQTEEAEKDVYREDLERVVRPRRPSDSAKSATRRLAPLMLVSEQRVDAPQAEAAAPVSPRRVSSVALSQHEAESEELRETATLRPQAGDSFADYAEAAGAESLSDMLEAAAAYSTLVEGRDTVTRPQIMRLASEALPEEFPLEERLRSFGQLLRQGKIRKIQRGQFTVADGSRFKPEYEAAG